MAIKRPTLLKLAAPLAVFAALLAVLTLSNGSDSLPDATGGSDIAATPTGDTRALIESLQRAVADSPGRAEGYAALGDAYLQRARETGEPSLLLARGARLRPRPLRRDPRNQTAVIGAGTLALARHDFDKGLRARPRARSRWRPDTVRPYARDRRRAGRARAATPTRAARCSGWSTSSPTSPPTRACRTSASSPAT